MEFLSYRFIEPGKAILDDLVLNKRQRLTDPAAINDAKESLRRVRHIASDLPPGSSRVLDFDVCLQMLNDFIQDTEPRMPLAKRRSIVENMDMSVVSDQYDKEIRSAVKNVFSGKIVRMLLIQLQFTKKELLVAMEAIDDLFNANKVNLQIFAVIPALFTTYLLYRGVTYVVGVAASRRIYSTAGVHSALRKLLRDIERLLILYPRPVGPGAVPALSSQDGRAWDTCLDEPGLGNLVLLVAEFQNVVRTNAPKLDASVRKTIEEDLTDLLTGVQTVEQQLASLNRVRRAYGFLQSSPLRWLTG
jgi:nuclear control of ATPase protein 2